MARYVHAQHAGAKPVQLAELRALAADVLGKPARKLVAKADVIFFPEQFENVKAGHLVDYNHADVFKPP